MLSRSKRARTIEEDDEIILNQESHHVITPIVCIQHEEVDNGRTTRTTSQPSGLAALLTPTSIPTQSHSKIISTMAELETWQEKMKAMDFLDDAELEREIPGALLESGERDNEKVGAMKGRKARAPRGDPVLHKWAEDNNVNVYLSEMLRLDGRAYAFHQIHCPDCEQPFSLASTSKQACYRCLGCEDSRLYCKSCIVKNHSYLPFHKLQEWRNGFFQPVTLHSLGAIFQLGHPTGTSCICEKVAPLQELVVLDVTGVHKLRICYCACETQQARWKQLFRSRLFPATQETPSTVATFRLLGHFHLLSFMSKASAREYYYTLE
ncbi:hypothetical protein VKT23_017482 [Stygiomarasmius scandens]|uniref:CxC2-like cysteine cluster KDZ transposase-associated domain-containing protein n=1 Tax=Marasmiellus scandens TaxID=2682957 RepID=A0ABR1IRX5_9AGAR